MKVEPRAVKLVKIWNGNPRHQFAEVLAAYRLGMRAVNDHLVVSDLLQVWLLRVPPVPFSTVMGYYVKSVEVVDEVNADEKPLLEASEVVAAANLDVEIESAWQARLGMDGAPKAKTTKLPAPMAPTVRTKEPVKRFGTSYLDGHRRTMD